MAFFKFRKSNDEHSAPAPAPESAETLRKRARYRLAGAAFLVLVGVVGFPMLFDNQPRPIAVDIPIEIPDKAKVKPLTAAGDATAPQASASRAATGALEAAPAKDAKPVQKEELVIASTSAPAASKPALPVAPKADAKPEATPDTKSTGKDSEKSGASVSASAKAAEAAKAQALLEGKAPDKAAEKSPAASDAGRFIVQFGAFTDVVKAREARQKVERAGMKTYAQVVQSPEGKKFRVRVGPFASKAEAEKAAEKIKKLNLPAAILEL
jgi:DedD protein